MLTSQVLTSNKITWNNIDLPANVKEQIVRDLEKVEVSSVHLEGEAEEIVDDGKLTITLMTGPQCSLCVVAKAVIAGASAKVIWIE